MYHVLQYKTRGNCAPHGLPRVYFSARGDDFNRYFERISNEILKRQSCSVWYDDGTGEPISESEHRLDFVNRRFSLFVLPVTSFLLANEDCRTLAELRLAKENHIPILPLMQEGDLSEIFNEKCGNLQYLEQDTADPSALSYEEKLDKFLASVLHGDEQLARIRSEFDAYIFLSYRKKDREHAQRLMRLIHEIEFCRDIAIWYDEFLTPGENFNDEIGNALVKSDLVTLAVTPNLLEDGNYVLETEYKEARRHRKPILPVEVVATDRDELNRKFVALPEAVSASDTAALSEALQSRIRALAIPENDQSAEHNYLIGLAYLSGIDVEANHDRALSLITSASEDGYAEATRKLAEMYQNGEGVARDPDAAVSMQERLVGQLEAALAEAKTADLLEDFGNYVRLLEETAKGHAVEEDPTVTEYLDALLTLGDAYRETSRHTDALHTYKRLADAAKPYTGTSLAAHEALILSHARSGQVYEAIGDMAQASHEFFEYEQSADTFRITFNTRSAWNHLCTAHRYSGDLALAEGHLWNAESEYERAKEYADVIELRGFRREYEANALPIEKRRGEILFLQGEPERAKEHYESALLLAKKRCEQEPSAYADEALLETHLSLAEVLTATKQYGDAEEQLAAARQIADALTKDRASFSARRLLALTYVRFGDYFTEKSAHREAAEQYGTALTLLKELCAETNTVRSKTELLRCHVRLGDALCKASSPEAAKPQYESALELAVLAVRPKTARHSEALRNFALALDRMGQCASLCGDPASAHSYYEDALQLRNEIVKKTDLPDVRDELAMAHARLASVQKGIPALRTALRARRMEKKLAWQYPDVPLYQRHLSAVNRRLGISEKGSVLHVLLLLFSIAFLFLAEYRRLALDMPNDFWYWVLNLLTIVFSFPAFNVLFENRLLNRYREKAKKKKKADPKDYLSARCSVLSSYCIFIGILAFAMTFTVDFLLNEGELTRELLNSSRNS